RHIGSVARHVHAADGGCNIVRYGDRESFLKGYGAVIGFNTDAVCSWGNAAGGFQIIVVDLKVRVAVGTRGTTTAAVGGTVGDQGIGVGVAGIDIGGTQTTDHRARAGSALVDRRGT